MDLFERSPADRLKPAPFRGLLAALGGACIGAALLGVASFLLTRTTGIVFLGLGGLIAGAAVGYPLRHVARSSHRALPWAAAALALLAAIAGTLLFVRLGSGKPFHQLLDPNPLAGPGSLSERQLTLNSLFNLGGYLTYAIAAFTAYYTARRA